MYIIYYSLGSAIFLIIFIISYFSSKKIHTKRDVIYSYALFAAFISVLFDAIAAYCERFAMSIPKFWLYIFNSMFILGMHTFLVIMVYYFFVITNTKISKRSILLFFPYIMLLVLLILSYFTEYGIFYIDNNHIYQHGFMYLTLYIVTVFYLIIYVGFVIINRNVIRHIAKLVLLLAIIFGAILVLIQYLYNQYLLTASATSLSVVMMYYALQSPSKYTDSLTGLINHVGLEPVIEKNLNHKNHFSLVLITINSINEIGQKYGDSFQTSIIKYVATNIIKQFSNCSICRAYYAVFAITIDPQIYNEHKIAQVFLNFPTEVNFDNINTQIHVNFSVLKGTDFSSTTDVIGMIDYVISQKYNDSNSIFYVNNKYLEDYKLQCAFELEIRNIVLNNQMSLDFSNIYDNNGKIVIVDGILSNNDSKYNEISFKDLMKVIVKNNLFNDVCDIILDNTKKYIDTYKDPSDIPYVVVNLPLKFYENKDFNQVIDNKFAGNKKYSEKILFAFVEKRLSQITKETLENIKIMNKKGYKIILNEFGIGYTDGYVLMNLEIFAVKINNKYLKETLSEENQKSFLSLMYNITKDINIRMICLGYDSFEEREQLSSYGIKYFQKV